MDEPVTDLVFVSSKDNCPKGYRMIETCPCGHEAQLWEKVLGGESGERYLCFTKEDKDGLVIEDMYIPGRGTQYLYKGYKIVKETVEGDDPMYHRQLAVKKVPRSHASKVIADIIICRSRDNVSKMYKKLDKVNGLCICFRQMDVGGRNSPSPKHSRKLSPSPTPSPSSKRGSVNLGDLNKQMTGASLTDGGSPRRSTISSYPAAAGRSISPLATNTHHSPSPSPQPPSHLHSPPSLATVEFTYNLEASPPPTDQPSAPPLVTGDHRDTSATYPSPPTTTAPPPSAPHTQAQSYPPAPSSTYPSPPPSSYPHSTPSTYPPPPSSSTSSSTYPPPSSTYPPPPSSSTYPPQPPSSTYPPPPSSYNTPLGFGGVMGGTSGYPPQQPYYPSATVAPAGYGNYSSIAGSSFMAAPTPPSSGPAPYNPYQTQGHTPYHTQPGQSTTPSYGFKF